MSITFGRMPGVDCKATAVKVVEGYSPRETAHGSLDATVYVCEDHHQVCRNEWLPRLGMTTTYTLQHPPMSPHRCGYMVDYRDLDGLVEEKLVAVHEELGEVVEDRLDRESPRAAVYPMHYALTVNGQITRHSTFRDLRGAVADLVTRRLAVAPERVAEEAQAMHALFLPRGAVQQALDVPGGEWCTVFDQFSSEQLRIRITSERD